MAMGWVWTPKEWRFIAFTLLGSVGISIAVIAYLATRSFLVERQFRSAYEAGLRSVQEERLEDAVRHCAEALAVREKLTKALDEGYYRALVCLGVSRMHLASDHLDVATIEQAEIDLRQALSIAELVRGPESTEVASTLSGLARANLVHDQILAGDECAVQRAEYYALRALRIHESLRTIDTPEYAELLNLVGNACARSGRIEDAADAYRESLLVYKRVAPDGNQQSQITEENYTLTIRMLEERKALAGDTDRP
jgi:tetratricopeptide (TPR) repeat protein